MHLSFREMHNHFPGQDSSHRYAELMAPYYHLVSLLMTKGNPTVLRAKTHVHGWLIGNPDLPDEKSTLYATRVQGASRCPVIHDVPIEGLVGFSLFMGTGEYDLYLNWWPEDETARQSFKASSLTNKDQHLVLPGVRP